MRRYFPEHKFSTALQKKILLIAIILAIYTNYSIAQSLPLHKLPAHTNVAKVSWRDSIYMYSGFRAGKMTFMTGFTPVDTFRFNYNQYLGSIDFISHGDTLQVKPTPELKIISIDEHLFLNNSGKGYVEVILNAPISLGVFTFFQTEKMTSVSGQSTIDDDIRGIPSVYDRYYRLAKSYYFIDQQNKIHKAIKPSILRLFPDQKEKIKEYLEQNKTDFTKETDLTSLLNFCNQL